MTGRAAYAQQNGAPPEREEFFAEQEHFVERGSIVKINEIRLEFDPDKDAINCKKHGVLEAAAEMDLLRSHILEDPCGYGGRDG